MQIKPKAATAKKREAEAIKAQEIAREIARVVSVINQNKDVFRPDFPLWVGQNYPIWHRFVSEA